MALGLSNASCQLLFVSCVRSTRAEVDGPTLSLQPRDEVSFPQVTIRPSDSCRTNTFLGVISLVVSVLGLNRTPRSSRDAALQGSGSGGSQRPASESISGHAARIQGGHNAQDSIVGSDFFNGDSVVSSRQRSTTQRENGWLAGSHDHYHPRHGRSADSHL
jgi:hypothetical protein